MAVAGSEISKVHYSLLLFYIFPTLFLMNTGPQLLALWEEVGGGHGVVSVTISHVTAEGSVICTV